MRNLILTIVATALIVTAYFAGKRYFLRPGIENGVNAFDFSGILPDGRSFTLKELRGKYVLLDFWGSWCKPCRDSHPELKKLYAEFHNASFKNADGFEIVSFGVEKNMNSWQNAIVADELKWPYQLVSSDLFDHPVVQQYNVRQIPTKFLINPDGRIIAVDPSIDQVRKLLAEYAIR